MELLQERSFVSGISGLYRDGAQSTHTSRMRKGGMMEFFVLKSL